MKTTMKVFILALAFFSCNNQKSANTPEEINKWINQEISKTMTDLDIPALSVAIIKDGELFLSKGFGVMERGTEKAVNENSIYQIASQSKSLTGMIVNHLILEGKLDAEEPITTYLSKVLDQEAIERLKKVKLKNVLQHNAGIGNEACLLYRERVNGEYWLKGYSKEELIKDLNQMELVYEPGTNWDYSNSGYAILGFICETVSEKNYEDLLREYVSQKIQLENTVVNLNEAQQSKLVTPYKPDNRKEATKASVMGMATPGSAVYSSVSDLSKIMLGQIKAYREKDMDNPLVLTKEVTPSDMGDNFFYGYGMIVQEGETTMYGHGGDADGFGCEYFFFPSENMGLVILSASGGDWMKKLSFDILDKLKGKEVKQKESIARAMLKITDQEDIAAALAFFEKEKDSSKYLVDVDELNGLGYKLMGKGKLEEAIEVFKLNVKLFPENGNVYDSLGEAYLKKGEELLGLENYKKSVALDPSNTNAMEILKKYNKE